MDGSETVCKNLHSRLHSAVKQCQVEFGGKSEIATEQDECVQTVLCEWACVLSHGVRQKGSGSSLRGLLGKGGSKEEHRLWRLLRDCLSAEDVQRLQSLSQVRSGAGLVRAWLRSALNERTLEDTLTAILRCDKLSVFYEAGALVLDQEHASTLPDMAAGLNSIIFALPLDDPRLDLDQAPPPGPAPRSSPPLATLGTADDEFKVVPVPRGGTRPRLSPDDDSLSVSSSQLSCASFDDLDTLSTRHKGLCASSEVTRKSCDELLEEAVDATRSLLGLGPPALQQDQPGQMSHGSGSHSVGELRQALLSVISQKELLEQECGLYKERLLEEEKRSGVLEEEVARLTGQLEVMETGNKARMDEIERENDVLRDQLRQYVGMLQTQQQGEGQGEGQDEGMQSKLSEMANLHGEVMEHNTRLRKKLVDSEKTVQALKDRLTHEMKRPPKTYSLPDKCPVYVWVPSVIRQAASSESFHVYQILVKVHKDEWNVYRRYSEFRDFHKAIQKDVPELTQFSFPPKKALASKSPEILEDRRLRLQEFLRTVVRVCSQPKTVGGERRPPYITPSTSKAKLIRLLPFLTESKQSLLPSAEQAPVSHYSGL